MLSGPKAPDDYFTDGHSLLRGGFTPNESSVRSGMTPGGGGSMFPAPSPGTQALYNSLQSEVPTPATMDFQRTALSAARREPSQMSQSITSQPQEIPNGTRTDHKLPGQFDDANDAANGLFMLAQSRNIPQPPSHYTLAPQQIPIHSQTQPPTLPMPTAPPIKIQPINGHQRVHSSPILNDRNAHGSVSTASGRGNSVVSNGNSGEDDAQVRPTTRGKKRSQTQPTGRRKTEDGKGPASKKGKANNGTAHAQSSSVDMDEPPSDEEVDQNKEEFNSNGKKMTEEEKRKNFLERNRLVISVVLIMIYY